MKTIDQNVGSGGRMMHEFIVNSIAKKLKNPTLLKFDDSAVLTPPKGQKIAMTTDSYVITPLFFEGADIGRLAVCGTVNDLTTSGAVPKYLSLAFILEEGTDIEVIDRIVTSIAKAAKEAGIIIVTGDTKVVEKGKGDQIYINTCGIGFIKPKVKISTHNAKANDIIFVTGTLGDHEVALMKARGMIPFDLHVKSDAAPLNKQIEKVLKTAKIHSIKDPTRGGLASALNEIADHSKVEVCIVESELPASKEVTAVCELLGLDTLYMANEGKFVIVAPKESLKALQKNFPEGKVIGKINKGTSKVILKTKSGGVRKISMLETVQLPRIC